MADVASDKPPAAPSRALDLVALYNLTADAQRNYPNGALPDVDDESMTPIVQALQSLGHKYSGPHGEALKVRALGVSFDNLSALESLEADFALNFCEGTGLDGNPGVEVVTALERRGIPFSGVGSRCYWLTSDKWRTKTQLSAARVPVPYGTIIPAHDIPLPSSLRFPLIVKPRDAFGSLGIDETSVVRTPAEALRAINRVLEEFGTEALVEHYVEGREISVGVLGTGRRAFVMPPLEVEFGDAYAGKPNIRTFATKSDPDSDLYHGFRAVCPAALSPEEERRVRQVALQAYRAVGGDGYGRVDLRLSTDGTPYVLEVNSNCSLEDGPHESDCGLFVLMSRALGWSYAEMLGHLIDDGLQRAQTAAVQAIACRWHGGRPSTHVLLDCPAGSRLSPVGPIYRANQPSPRRATLPTSSGRHVFVEPPIRYLDHSPEPNVEIVRDGTALWLESTRRIAAGEPLAINRGRPIDLAMPARRPRAHGRRLSQLTLRRAQLTT